MSPIWDGKDTEQLGRPFVQAPPPPIPLSHQLAEAIEDLPERMRMARLRRHLTQREAQTILGLGQGTISHIETAKSAISLGTLLIVLRWLEGTGE